MRIKTVPRHRMLQSNIKTKSALRSSSEESDADIEKNYDSIEAYAPPSKILIPIATFASSNKKITLSSSTSTSLSLINDDNNNVEVMNLSTKDTSNRVDDIATVTSVEPENKLKGSFLYKIMTDPNFLKNIQRNKQPKKFFCVFCQKEFATCEELASHMDAKRNESNQIVCCACRKTFTEKRYLKYHQRCHSNRTKFTCDICTKKYTRLDNLTRHNVLHVNPDKYSCTICKKTFTRKDLLNKHRKSHEKCNLYCVKCGKYFRSMLTLENHQKIHRQASSASANIVVYKTEGSVSVENLICKTENLVSAEHKVYESHDSTLGESLVCKTDDVTRKT
ncbi:PREDICTED: zinc finger protein 613-like [Vollenhovia emeryi]|uniref:zinc finger protein 613-like n=1 Tax=Vollenhovia emeryi TaxID=411798 RepID=UPI0005F5421D|nr:PREDICTED: zinc finger protein 613-like [Vollenhovia emeryi]